MLFLMRCAAALLALWSAAATGQNAKELRIAVGGSEPFVILESGTPDGIAVEIWQAVAAKADWRYSLRHYPSVPEAMHALKNGDVDVAVGPISITAERAKYARFSQPFFSSYLAILSRSETPDLWYRLAPFFSGSFFYAVGGLLAILAVVGALIWIAEHRCPDSHFPQDPLHGIGNGIWFAIVTMSTVGYGDMAPRTVLGRIVTGIWIIISVIAATSLVAGIASTLTLTGINTELIASAEQLRNRSASTLADSPGQAFAARYGARVRGVATLPESVALLEQRAVDAVIFDRPQIQYFLKHHRTNGVVLSAADYAQQNYGFAIPLSSRLQHDLNLHLLELRESGALDRIVERWLGQPSGD